MFTLKNDILTFVGWATSNLLKQYRGKKIREESKENTAMEILGNQSIQCLECMRILHKEAMEDSEYITKHYSLDVMA